MATSEEVAKLAGVSRATVSRALNGSARVSAEAKERVHAAITALGYEPDVIAQSLVRQRSRVIAMSLFAQDHELPLSHFELTSQYFYLRVLENIEREAISLGYDLLLPSHTHGKAPDGGLMRQSGWNIDGAYEAARILLAERRDFTAIIAGSDFMAIGILRALTEQGLRVPDDVSLVGFNDIEFCSYTNPPLTTVRQ